MTGDLSTPAHLRALVEALPERHRSPWHTEAGPLGSHVEVYAEQVNAWILEATSAPVAELSATVASPPVVLALADHLEALAAFHEPAVGQPIAFDEVGQAIRRLLRTRDALEAAIHRTGGTG